MTKSVRVVLHKKIVLRFSHLHGHEEIAAFKSGFENKCVIIGACQLEASSLHVECPSGNFLRFLL